MSGPLERLVGLFINYIFTLLNVIIGIKQIRSLVVQKPFFFEWYIKRSTLLTRQCYRHIIPQEKPSSMRNVPANMAPFQLRYSVMRYFAY